MDKIEFYLISIKRSGTYRRKNIKILKKFIKENFLKELKVFGYDGKGLSSNEKEIKKLKDLKILRDEENFREMIHVNGSPRNLTDGEIGVFISHYQIWEDIKLNNIDKAIIFEDDAACHPYMRQELGMIFNNPPKNMNFIQFQHHFLQVEPRNNRFRKRTEDYDDNLYKIKGDLFGLAGYYVTNMGANKFIKNLLPIKNPVDTSVMFYLMKTGTGYVTKKPLVELMKKAKSFIGPRG